VLATIPDMGAQPRWLKEILKAEVLDGFEDGNPASAHFTAAVVQDRVDAFRLLSALRQ
jgi:hypothetical protein